MVCCQRLGISERPVENLPPVQLDADCFPKGTDECASIMNLNNLRF